MTKTRDQVTLKDLSIHARHGLFDAEAELGQRFYIDVAIGGGGSSRDRGCDPRAF